MIYKQFKTHPVQAFYKLLIFSFLRIMLISLGLSVIYFIIVKFIILNSMGESTIKQIGEIFTSQQSNPGDFAQQSKDMQALFIKNPQIINLIFGSMGILIVFISYTIAITQKLLKNKIMGIEASFLKELIPGREIINILLYILLFFPLFITVFGLAFISLKANPIFSLISLIFLIMVVIRSLLFIPGCVIGEMTFSESLKYSFQTIKAGRAFKITVFGFLVFVLISIVINFMFYFPMLYLKFEKSDLFYNFLVIFIQTGVISVALASLFTRYGNFEEENLQ